MAMQDAEQQSCTGNKLYLHPSQPGYQTAPPAQPRDFSLMMIVCFGITIMVVLIDVYMQMGMFPK